MENMPYQIRYSSMEDFLLETNKCLSKWQECLQNIQEKAGKIIHMDSFSGATADSVKGYLSEVYAAVTIGLSQAIVAFQSKYLLYKQGYYNIESNIYSVLTTSTMKWYYDRAKERENWREELDRQVNDVLGSVADIVYLPAITSATLQLDLDSMRSRCETLGNSIQEYETAAVDGELRKLKELVRSVREMVASYKNTPHRIGSYVPGSFASDKLVLQMAEKVQDSMNDIALNQQRIEKAVEQQNVVYGQMKADYEEACEAAAKARADKGGAQVIRGVAAVTLGTICIVATAGAASVVIAGIGIAGGASAIAFGASETFEGSQEVTRGFMGDITTASFNPIRDTIFVGNQEAYSAWGTLSMTVAGIMIPMGSAVDTAIMAGATTKEMAKTVLFTMGKEALTDAVSDKIAGDITGIALERMEIGETGAALLNIGLSLVVQKGVEKGTDVVIDRVSSSKDFSSQMYSKEAARYDRWMEEHTGMAVDMDASDAAKYSQFMSECELGIHNPYPGLTEADIKNWGIADQHVQESLVLSQVDGESILKLRAEEIRKTRVMSDIEAEEYAFQAIRGHDNADAFVIGKYGTGGPDAYSNVAEDIGAHYFYLDKYDELVKLYSQEEIWKINQKFLDIEMSSGREIYFSHDPALFEGDGSFFSMEIEYLRKNGYMDNVVYEGGLWHAKR